MTSRILCSLDDVIVGYDRQRPVIAGLTHSWSAGVGLLKGRNMAGKSTLLRAIAGEIAPFGGKVVVEGRCEYLDQNFIETLFPWKSTAWNVALPALITENRSPHELLRERLSGLPILTGIEPILEIRPPALSGGMQHFIAVARAFASNADVLLLDEPFTGLDPLARRLVVDSIHAFARNGARQRLALVVSHDSDGQLDADFCHQFPEAGPADRLLNC